VRIGHDVGRVQQMIIRQVADRAAMIVGGKHAVPEGCLMEPLLDQAESVAALNCIRRRRRGSSTRELACL
jgi:hypothetical protein